MHTQTRQWLVHAQITHPIIGLLLCGSLILGGCGQLPNTDRTVLPASVIEAANDEYTLVATPDEADPGKWIFEAKPKLTSAVAPVRFEWDFGDGSTVEGTDVAHTYVGPGSYTVTLTAFDSRDNVVFVLALDMEIPSFNRTPEVDAGGNQTVYAGVHVVLDGSACTDADGDVLSFSWEQVSGTPVELTNHDEAITSFLSPFADEDVRLVFVLTVSDGEHIAEQTATVDVLGTIDPATFDLVADAGEDQLVNGSGRVSLDGSASSGPEEAVLTFEWNQVSGPAVELTDADKASAGFVAPSSADSRVDLTFELLVSDGEVVDVDEVTITVAAAGDIVPFPCAVGAECDDGLFCNGTETCESGYCKAGSDPCPGQMCDNPTAECFPEVLFVLENTDGQRPLTVEASAVTVNGEPLPDGVYTWLIDLVEADEGQVTNHVLTSGGAHSIALAFTLLGSTVTISCRTLDTGTVAAKAYVWPLISGTVRDESGLGISGVTVSANADGTTTVTAPNGEFALHVPFDWSGTVTAQHASYEVTPSSLAFNEVREDLTDQHFTGTSQGIEPPPPPPPPPPPECTESADCSDGLFCNGAEACVDATCVGGSEPCPGQSCNEDTDSCYVGCVVDADCSDGVFCNGVEMCSGGTCTVGGDPCPGEFCDESGDACVECLAHVDCDDGLFCSGFETCLGGACQAGVNPCPGNECDETADACVECLEDAHCDDGSFCNGIEACAGGSCGTGSDPCPGQLCDESGDACVDCLVDADCGDGLFCDGAEVCSGGSCVSGSNPCPGLSCNETLDVCVGCSLDAECNDGLFCDGAETCDGGTCQDGADPCPGQQCDEVNDECVECLADAHCDDDVFCNGPEVCIGGSCQAGSDPCAGRFCDESADACVDCLENAHCADGAFCTGFETCLGGSCQVGLDPCPGQLCDESGDRCVECLIDTDCDDEAFCTGMEQCTDGTCDAGTDPCPGQYCDEFADACADCLSDVHCDDGVFCNGAEVCLGGTCLAGAVPCPGQYCNEVNDACVDCLINAHCDDGAFCTGVETCGGGTCQSGSDPCPAQVCEEVTDTCVACAQSAVLWQNFPFESQGGLFTAEFDAIPNGAGIDALTTLSLGEAAAFSDLAIGVRFNLVDVIDVRNGGSYGADTVLTYAPDTSYHVRMIVNVPSHTYSVFVTPRGGSEVTLAADFAFRTEQSSVASLDHWAVQADTGTHLVCNFTAAPGPNLPPEALGDKYTVEPDGTLNVAAPGVLSNDRDPEGSPLEAILVGDAPNGTLTLQADGSFTYVPAPGFLGTDGFTYRADDGEDQSGVASVTITIGTLSWTPPIGIPAPDFGIEETHEMYAGAHFAAGGFDYRDAGNGPYTHYVDNTASGSTDSGNPYGTPAQPRRTIPLNLPPGSVVEVHGGPYTYSNPIRISGVGSAVQPIFVRGGDPSNRPVFPGPSVVAEGSYIIIENLDLDGSSASFSVTATVGSTNHHISFRHSEIRNTTSASAVATAGYINSPDDLVHHIVIYNNNIHDMGDWQAPVQADRNCVGVLKNSRYIWVVDNELHHNQGDGVAMNWWGHGDLQVPPQFIYIGRNHIHHNHENALDFKCPRDVIVSQNVMHTIRATADGSGPGDAVVVHNDDSNAAFPYPDSIWFLYNEIYDTEIGITCNSIHDLGAIPSRTYIIGNVFHDIMAYSSPLRANNLWSPGVAVRVLNRAQVTAANNVVFRCDLGMLGGNQQAEMNTIGNIITDLTDNYYNAFGSQPYQIIVSSAVSAAASQMHHNLLWQGGNDVRIGWGGSTYSSVTAFQAATGKGVGSLDGGAPRLVDPAGADGDSENHFNLLSDSPCIDAGFHFAADPTEGLIRFRDDALSEGRAERAMLIEGIISDLQPPVDDAGTANTGTGAGGVNYCDIGAFERQAD